MRIPFFVWDSILFFWLLFTFTVASVFATAEEERRRNFI